jgi:hypothetical protein
MSLISTSWPGRFHSATDSMRFDMCSEVLEEEMYIQCSVTDRALRRLAPGFQVTEANIRKAFDQHRAAIERIASKKFDAHKVESSGDVVIVVKEEDVPDRP